MQDIIPIKSIHEAHQLLQLKAPKHPLITVYKDADIHFSDKFEGARLTAEMYYIAFKQKISGSIDYGRNSYDFEDSTMIFLAPNQVMTMPTMETIRANKGWSIMFHPDLIRQSHLGETIKDYSFFSYESNEALHLSSEESQHITNVVAQIQKEYKQNIDAHSQRLIISNLELLLNYCTRFYDRQFFTRTNLNKGLATDFEKILDEYINTKTLIKKGIPTVSYFGEQLNMSPNYLSDLLKKETGKSAKAHINYAIINKAKTILLNSTESISQIAYDLGFEYPQSFSRLFKSKTGHSPMEYRNLN